MDGGAWLAVDHGVTKSRTWLSIFTFTFHFHALEKEMATHSSVPAWRIPGMGEPGGLLSVGSHRVRHDRSDSAAASIISLWAIYRAFLVTQQAMQEMQVWSLGWEDPLEKEMATHSSILAWEIPWSEKPGRLQSMGSPKSQTWVSGWTTTKATYEWEPHLSCSVISTPCLLLHIIAEWIWWK